MKSEFKGIQIGEKRLPEHYWSIVARHAARQKNQPEPEKVFAWPGGSKDKPELVRQSTLEDRYGKGTLYGYNAISAAGQAWAET